METLFPNLCKGMSPFEPRYSDTLASEMAIFCPLSQKVAGLGSTQAKNLDFKSPQQWFKWIAWGQQDLIAL